MPDSFDDINKNSKFLNAKHCASIEKRLSEIEPHFTERPGNRKVYHLPKGYQDAFWDKIPYSRKIIDHIKDEMYPFGKDHRHIWFSMIYGSEDTPGFHGLHQDKYFSDTLLEKKDSIYFTSTIIAKSDDMTGGKFIIGGDGWTTQSMNKAQSQEELQSNMSYRLKVIEEQQVGQSTTWSDLTIHGVSEVTKGKRITMMVSKS